MTYELRSPSQLLSAQQHEVHWASVFNTVKITVKCNSIPENLHVILKTWIKSSVSTHVLLGFTVLHAIAINSSQAVRAQLSSGRWMDRLEKMLKQQSQAVLATLVQVLTDWAFMFSKEELGMRSRALLASMRGRPPGLPTGPSPSVLLAAEEVKLGIPAVGPRRGEDFVKLASQGGVPHALDYLQAPGSSNSPSLPSPVSPPTSDFMPSASRPSIASDVLSILSNMARDCHALRELEVASRAAALQCRARSPTLRTMLDAGYVAAERCGDWRRRVQELVNTTHDDHFLSKLLAATDTINGALECWQTFATHELFTLLRSGRAGTTPLPSPPLSAPSSRPHTRPVTPDPHAGTEHSVVPRPPADDLEALFSDLTSPSVSAAAIPAPALATSRVASAPQMTAAAIQRFQPPVASNHSQQPIPHANLYTERPLASSSTPLEIPPEQGHSNSGPLATPSGAAVYTVTGDLPPPRRNSAGALAPPPPLTLAPANGSPGSGAPSPRTQWSGPPGPAPPSPNPLMRKGPVWNADPFSDLGSELGLRTTFPPTASTTSGELMGRPPAVAAVPLPPVPAWLKDHTSSMLSNGTNGSAAAAADGRAHVGSSWTPVAHTAAQNGRRSSGERATDGGAHWANGYAAASTKLSESNSLGAPRTSPSQPLANLESQSPNGMFAVRGLSAPPLSGLGGYQPQLHQTGATHGGAPNEPPIAATGGTGGVEGMRSLAYWQHRLQHAMKSESMGMHASSATDAALLAAQAVLGELHSLACAQLASADESRKTEVANVKMQAVQKLRQYMPNGASHHEPVPPSPAVANGTLKPPAAPAVMTTGSGYANGLMATHGGSFPRPSPAAPAAVHTSSMPLPGPRYELTVAAYAGHEAAKAIPDYLL